MNAERLYAISYEKFYERRDHFVNVLDYSPNVGLMRYRNQSVFYDIQRTSNYLSVSSLTDTDMALGFQLEVYRYLGQNTDDPSGVLYAR